MKKIILLSLFSIIAFTGFSQTKAENDAWLLKIDEAYALSEATGKPILANFTGSDWCGWCKRLTASVFSKPDFEKWAAENVILLELDFPRRSQLSPELKAQNAQLQQVFSVTGFPTIWVFNMDKDAESGQFKINALGKTGYRGTVKEFTDDVERIISNGK